MKQLWTQYGPWCLAALMLLVALGWLRRTAVAQEPTPELVRSRLQTGARILDVRTPEEYHQHHLPGAINVPLDAIHARVPELFPDRQQTLFLYCRSGRRSNQALQELRQLGYTNVWNLGGLNRAAELVAAAGATPPSKNQTQPEPDSTQMENRTSIANPPR
ncbi:MAG: rhodanese-like domain-containing protein [Verrucomicrobiota bacterium]|nr:rhodanese-like domain-containing protein [Limisphaera sp.]MDW8382654.1 rhodanese-like domain-containing protein [Verrucomicrobiota bacterium]